MAEIHPFRGIRYNQQLVGNMGAVICPPYDVITPEEQKSYYEKSDYNIIRLEYSLELLDDTSANNKHTRAAATLAQWLRQSILQRDNVPAFYIHEQQFTYKGMRQKRLGFMGCVKLEPWERKIIYPHEGTVAGIKSDRLALMRACQANISPLLALYDDPGQKVVQLLLTQTRRKLVLDFTTDRESHKVWMVTEPEFIQRVSHFLASKPLYIADGHHRYETALTYQRERQLASSATGEEAFNFIMMTLVSLSGPGLIVLPVHRLIRGLAPSALAGLRHQLQDFFEIKFISSYSTELSGGSIGVLGMESGQTALLKLRPGVALSDIMPRERSEVYYKLDVSLFQHLILEKLIGPLPEGSIGYTPNVDIAQSLVEKGEYQLAFLLNPIPVSQIKAIADANDCMPGKSTYFYPKLPTGLVLNSLVGKL